MPDPTPPSTPAIPLETFLEAITGVTRWNILRELADGGSLMVSELAQRLNCDPSVISRQITPLRQAGILIAPRNRLYEIAPQFLADKNERTLDFGWGLLRMNVGK
jgi:DNA-binding transcriptional ArsR family regulator